MMRAIRNEDLLRQQRTELNNYIHAFQRAHLLENKGQAFVINELKLVNLLYSRHYFLFHRQHFRSLNVESFNYDPNNANSGFVFFCPNIQHVVYLDYLIEFFEKSGAFFGTLIPKEHYLGFIDFLVDDLGLKPTHPYLIKNDKLKEILDEKLVSVYGNSKKAVIRPRTKLIKERNLEALYIHRMTVFSKLSNYMFKDSGIGGYVILDCDVLQSSFENTSNLEVVILKNRCRKINHYSFKNSSLKYLVHPGTIEDIEFGSSIFEGTVYLKGFITFEQCGIEDGDSNFVIVDKVNRYIKFLETKKKSSINQEFDEDEEFNNDDCDDEGFHDEDQDEECDDKFNHDCNAGGGGRAYSDDECDNESIPSLEECNEECDKLLTCVSCYDKFVPKDCICCEGEEKTITCSRCFGDMVSSQTNDKAEFDKYPKIKCCVCKTFFEEKKTIRFLQEEMVDHYLVAKNEAVRSRTTRQLNTLHENEIATMKDEMVELITNKEFRITRLFPLLRTRLCELLQEVTKCPHCKGVFYSWDGCMAVKHIGEDRYGRTNGCGMFFCGWCTEGFQNDILCHEHTKTCKDNTKHKGSWGGTMEDVYEMRAIKYKDIVETFLQEQVEEMEKVSFLQFIEKDLQHLNVEICLDR